METYKTKYQKKAKTRTDKFLSGELDQLTRSDVQRFVKAGNLKINGKTVNRPSALLTVGDRIEFSFSLSGVKPVPGKLVVRFESPDVLVVEKPAGVVVFPTRKGAQKSLAGMVLAKYPSQKNVGDAGRMGVVHRLDKDTSGLVIVARNSTSYDYFKGLFAARKISKEYLALVYGKVKQHDIIQAPLSKIGQRGSSRVRVDEREGKTAKTEYWLERLYIDGPARRSAKSEGGVDEYSLVRIELHTGRTHQIRVHFADQGHPVMGDKLYGKPESLKLKPVLDRQFLHAIKLEFQSPDGTWVEVESPLPGDLEQVLKSL